MKDDCNGKILSKSFLKFCLIRKARDLPVLHSLKYLSNVFLVLRVLQVHLVLHVFHALKHTSWPACPACNWCPSSLARTSCLTLYQRLSGVTSLLLIVLGRVRFLFRVDFPVRGGRRGIERLPPMMDPGGLHRISRIGQDPETAGLPLAAALHRDGALHDAALAAVGPASAGADPEAESEYPDEEDGQQRHCDDPT